MVTLGIFCPTRGFFHPDPREAVEVFDSLQHAQWIFRQRAFERRTCTYYLISANAETHWFDADKTASLDLWFENETPEEPFVPDMFDRRLVLGPRGGVHQERY